MKALLPLPWLFASIAVVAALGCLLWLPREQAAHAPGGGHFPAAVAGPTARVVPPSNSAAGSPKKEVSLAERAARERYQEAKRKAEESKRRVHATFKKNSEKYTPEFCENAANGIMKQRDAHYKKLFGSWNLDAETTRLVLGILRERELRLIKNQGSYFQNASSSDGARQNLHANETEDLLAESELGILVGKSRAAELLTTARQLHQDELKAALAGTGMALPIGK